MAALSMAISRIDFEPETPSSELPLSTQLPQPSKQDPARYEQARELRELIALIAQHNQTAMAKFYDATHRTVFSLAFRILEDFSVAEEVILDVYMQVWTQAKNYSPDRGTPFAWVIMMARSRAIDRLRSAHHRKWETASLDDAFHISSNAETPEQSAITAEKRQRIYAALQTLSPEQRELIEIAYFTGLSQSEIAMKYGIPLGTVKTRMRVGLMRMREFLSNP